MKCLSWQWQWWEFDRRNWVQQLCQLLIIGVVSRDEKSQQWTHQLSLFLQFVKCSFSLRASVFICFRFVPTFYWLLDIEFQHENCKISISSPNYFSGSSHWVVCCLQNWIVCKKSNKKIKHKNVPTCDSFKSYLVWALRHVVRPMLMCRWQTQRFSQR